jgi:non-canonical purine NTP pyrophosphatase (RdgB/HAM1 family)
VVVAAAFAAVAPMLFLGNPSGHDFEFHLNSWMEVLGQWKQSIVYPRWAQFAHYGYGEARFLFYPPASWMLGAALGAVLPWAMVAGAYAWLALTAAGFSMFLLARRCLAQRNAIFAAAVYAANPYHIVIVYWRSAFAELLASSLLPLLLLLVLRMRQEGRKTIIPLALVVAAAWLTNAPSAVMVNYSLALLVVVVAVVERSPRVLLYGAAAVAIGAALAGFYLLPAAYEEKWVNIAQVLSPGVRPQDNFLFTTLSDVDHNRFNLLVSSVAVGEMVLLAGAIFLSRDWRHEHRAAWWTLVAWSGVASVLMCSFTFFFWQHLPKLRFVQLPWRWLLGLNVAFVMLLTIAFRRWLSRILLYAAILGVIVLVWHRVQAPWWDTAADIAEMRDNIQSGAGYEGTDEYVPLGADSYEIKKDARRIAILGGGKVRIHVQEWSPESRFFTVGATEPSRAVLRLFNYPAWRVEVNGRQVATQTREITGQLVIPLEAGENSVRVMFARTGDRLLGAATSVATLLLVLLVAFKDRANKRRKPGKRVLIATSNPGKLRDFSGAAKAHGIEVECLPGFSSLPSVVENGQTFEANAKKKAEFYSRFVPGEIVLADDSGLEVDALGGAPGVHSARYAADQPHAAENNTDDEANNARVLRELAGVPREKRTGRFVCVLVAARDGKTRATFRGEVEGVILEAPQGTGGFGYDPLFYFPQIEKTFAELTPEEKARYSHRGAAFRRFLEW